MSTSPEGGLLIAAAVMLKHDHAEEAFQLAVDCYRRFPEINSTFAYLAGLAAARLGNHRKSADWAIKACRDEPLFREEIFTNPEFRPVVQSNWKLFQENGVAPDQGPWSEHRPEVS